MFFVHYSGCEVNAHRSAEKNTYGLGGGDGRGLGVGACLGVGVGLGVAVGVTVAVVVGVGVTLGIGVAVGVPVGVTVGVAVGVAVGVGVGPEGVMLSNGHCDQRTQRSVATDANVSVACSYGQFALGRLRSDFEY